ncbi:MAG: sodium:alanine symporter family protein [Bacteroidales bacterium]|nr:sodium:alanine symporter family protein [Bacteroidales bacterium]MBQ2483589.1 sodium:alanine symporter family protein [Bacteroidales bacterium]
MEDSFISILGSYIKSFSDFLWGWPLIILLVGTHIFLTVRLRFPQRYVFKAIRISFKRDKGAAGDVSQFGALTTSLAATIGTGNIIGVATAVSLGGPGAVLWCWLTGVLGIATKYSEGLLAIKYRVRTAKGTMLGGPMYALERGVKSKFLAVLFCVLAALAAFGIGDLVQSNAISTLLDQEGLFGPSFAGIPKYWTGIAVAFLVMLVTFFGIKGIARVCGLLVPFMAIFYVLGCLIILGMNWSVLGETLSLIFKSAFTAKAGAGGIAGFTVMMACRYGIARGLFSNESGMGSAPIAAAAAQTKNPVRQALVSSTGTFWDTVIVCALTGLVLVSSIYSNPGIDYKDGAKLTQMAFGQIPYVGSIILTISLATFAFSTILGWSYYAERSVEYLAGRRTVFVYRIVWIVLIYIGAVMNLEMVWNFADILNGLMAIPNIISLLLLSGVLVSETRKYLWSKQLDKASDDEIPVITGRRAEDADMTPDI